MTIQIGQLSDPTSRSPETMIEAIGVSRVYRTGPEEVRALDGIDLTVSKGELIAVMGPSGSGKTTLLNCLSGLDELSEGDVVVEGTSLAKMSDGDRTSYRAKRMGFIFQAFNLLPVFTAVENVELPLLLVGTKPKIARERALGSLASVGLTERGNHRPAELSAGEQQRVAIARAIAPDPAVLWADEPTGNLDSENAEKVLSLLEHLNRDRDLTIVMVTHDRSIGLRAKRLVNMKDGKLIASGIA